MPHNPSLLEKTASVLIWRETGPTRTMRPLAPSEKTLFLILCGAVFVALNLLGLRAFLQSKAKVQKAIVSAKAELASDRSSVEVAESLRSAMEWIAAHPMTQMAPEEASAQLLKTEREEAEKAGLKVVEENLLPSQDGEQGGTVSVAAKLSGPFQGVVKMLFALQTPTEWRSVQKLTLQSDDQPPNVIAELELSQYFRPTTVSPQ
jgi:hypothetical protein